MLRRVFIFCGISLLIGAGIVSAANTGRLEGVVNDNQAVALPGVTVQISSITLIGGPQVAVSDGSGKFAFNLLPVGTYTVEANLAGFRPSSGEVRVTTGRVAAITFNMTPEQFGGEIEVSAEVPVVDTTQVNASVVWGEDYLQMASVGTANRSYQSILSQAAGVTGGSNPNVFGSTVGENAYLIDGMNTTDPVTGTWSTMFNIDAVQEMNFQTGGFEAEFGQATGGIVNLVTKSGGNEFSGSFDGRYRNEKMTESGEYYDPDELTESRQQYSATLGGPILRDKLWFFGSLQYIDSSSQDVFAHFPYNWEGWQFLIKGTWQASDNNRLTLRYSTDPAEIPGVNSGLNFLESSRATQEQGGDIFQLELNSVLSPSWLLNAQVGVSSNYIRAFSTDQPDTVSGHRNEDTLKYYNAYYRNDDDERPRTEARVHASWFLDDFGGAHEFKGGIEYNEVGFDRIFFYNGGARIYDFNPTGDPIDINGDGYINHYLRRELPEGTEKQKTSVSGETGTLFIQDSWRPIANLTVKPGVRLDNVKMFDDPGAQISDMKSWQPRLGAAWDIMGNARHVVRFSAGQFMDPTALNIPSFASGVEEIEQEFTILEYYCNLFGDPHCDPNTTTFNVEPWTNWDGQTYYLIDSDEFPSQPALTLDTAGLGRLKAPYSEQLILAYETQIAPEMSLEFSYIDKNMNDIVEDTCIGNTWAYGDGELPDIDDNTTWTQDCSRWLIVNMPVFERTYKAFIGKFESRKRWGHLMVSYTNSESKGTNISGPRHYAYGDGDYFPLNFYNNQGYLSDHRDHRLKANGYFLLPHNWNIGVDGFYSSPGHQTLQSTCDAFLGSGRYNSTTDQRDAFGIDPATLEYCEGKNPAYDILHAPRGSLEMKSVWQMDVQFSKLWRLGNMDLTAILTVQNLFGQEWDRTFNSTMFRQATSQNPDTGETIPLVYQDDDPNLPWYDERYGSDRSPVLIPIGAPLSYWDPRRYELGLRIEF